jgi:cytochrome P450
MKQFPWVYTILRSVPTVFLSVLHPLAKHLFDIRTDIRFKIDHIRSTLQSENDKSDKKAPSNTCHPTILHSLLTSSHLPPAELRSTRLEDEAFTLLGAGTITTAHTLTVIMFYILSNPLIKSRLDREMVNLYAKLPAGQATPSLKTLEHAEYLTAIISEGLRISFGVSHRLPRIARDTPLHYKGSMNGKDYEYTIPPGVPVSMTPMLIHLDPSIYPSPHTFNPERWLASACISAADKRALERGKQHLVPFSKGTRMCAGMNLAYAELYLMLGTLFAPGQVGTRMELFETDVEDVECKHDFFNPSAKLDSKGVRVILKENITKT